MIAGGRDVGLPYQKLEKMEENERVTTHEDLQTDSRPNQSSNGDPR